MIRTIRGCFLNILFMGAVGVILPLTGASASGAGCCSKHGGVSSCDAASGYLLCNDKTRSPSCVCDNKTANAQKTTTTSNTSSSANTTKQTKAHTTKQAKKDTQTKNDKTKNSKTTKSTKSKATEPSNDTSNPSN